MIYGANMGAYIKKAVGDKGFQTNINKIIETLPIDPEISNMDAVVLGPKDLGGMLGKSLLRALDQKHPSVGVVYVYQKDKEANNISGDVTKIKVPKITVEAIEQAINQIIEIKSVGRNEKEYESGDKINGGSYPQPQFETQRRADIIVQEVAATVEGSSALAIPVAPQQPLLSDEELESIMSVVTEESTKPELKLVESKTTEERIAELGEYGDWEFFKKSLEKDSVIRELLNENTQYSGVVNMLDVIDKTISNTFRDPSLSKEAKFDKIKQLGIDRSSYRGIQDSIIGQKVISIMDAVIRSAEQTVDSKVETIRKSLDKLATTQIIYQEQEKLHGVIEERLKIQADLMELTKEIIETYKVMDHTVAEIVENVDKDLATSNPYIGEMLRPVSYLFTPSNTAALVSKLMTDLQSNRVSMSALEGKISSLIQQVFKLCEIDNSIIEFQQTQIRLLQAQRVEDVIIIDSVIKSSLRLFVGPSESGRTATALTWCGTLSRRQNSLLIDLSGSSKFKQYGVEAVSLNEFLTDRIQRQFLCVEGTIDHDIESVDEIVTELKTRLEYYPYINIILSDKQIELMNKLAESALSVHFITNCTNKSIEELRPTIESLNKDNVAQKIVLIDPPIDPMSILNDLNIDPLMVKLIVIPRLQHIAACSLKKVVPYESREVVDVFEEAFR